MTIVLGPAETEKFHDFETFLRDQASSDKSFYFEGGKLASWVVVSEMTSQEIAWLLGKDIHFDNLAAVKSVLAWYQDPEQKQKLTFKYSERVAVILDQLKNQPSLYKEVLMLLVIKPAIKMHLVELTKMQDIHSIIKSEQEDEDENE